MTREQKAIELLKVMHDHYRGIGPVSDKTLAEIEDLTHPCNEFGEPWRVPEFGAPIVDAHGQYIVSFGPTLRSRIIACVNACAGMRDPVAEVAVLRGKA